jgi:microcystin degradation protein MlrC
VRTPVTVLIAGLRYEVNSFAPGHASLEAFRRRRVRVGDAILDEDHGDPISGAVSVGRAAGVRLVGALSATGGAGPLLARDAYAELRGDLLAEVERHAGAVDAVFVELHGATLADGQPDPEGDLLEAIRALVGPSVPIAAPLDMHANVTAAMASAADILVGYRTCPHVDFVETGAQAMRLLLDARAGRTAPRVVLRRVPMITPAERHDTRRAPMREVIDVVRDAETRPGVLSASIFATQPWLDVERLGWQAVVVADGSAPGGAEQGDAAADDIAAAAWDRRERFLIEKTPIADALAAVRACPDDERPYVLIDGSDSPSAGSTGDGVELLRALLADPAGDAACTIVTDAPAACACREAGVGAEVRLEVGATLSPRFFSPLPLTGRVRSVQHGRYRSIYPPGPVDCGTVAVVRAGSTDVVLTELPAAQLDRELYRVAGIDLAAQRIVGVKSAGGCREYYEPIAAGVIEIANRGPSSDDLPSLPYERISRPLFPFDDIEEVS